MQKLFPTDISDRDIEQKSTPPQIGVDLGGVLAQIVVWKGFVVKRIVEQPKQRRINSLPKFLFHRHLLSLIALIIKYDIHKSQV